MPIVGCCCCTETRETMGLPDALEMSLTLLSSGSDGLPADEAPSVSCGGVDWQVSTAVVDLLSSVTFDYFGAVGNCCWSYVARKDYTYDAGDAEGCGSPFTSAAVLFGDSPFATSYRDGNYVVQIITENIIINAPGDYSPCGPEDPLTHCCGDCPEVGDVAGTYYEAFSGTRITYTPVIGDGGLQICLAEDIVTISGTLLMYLGIIAKEGGYSYENGGKTGGALPCTDNDPVIEDETTVNCTAGDPIAEFPFSMSADISGISGANIWEKIKNCTTWEFDYAYGVCGAAAGCSSDGSTCIGPGTILASNCFPDAGCADGDSIADTTATDDPIDQVCLYSYGTLGVTFGDAA